MKIVIAAPAREGMVVVGSVLKRVSAPPTPKTVTSQPAAKPATVPAPRAMTKAQVTAALAQVREKLAPRLTPRPALAPRGHGMGGTPHRASSHAAMRSLASQYNAGALQ